MSVGIGISLNRHIVHKDNNGTKGERTSRRVHIASISGHTYILYMARSAHIYEQIIVVHMLTANCAHCVVHKYDISLYICRTARGFQSRCAAYRYKDGPVGRAAIPAIIRRVFASFLNSDCCKYLSQTRGSTTSVVV